MKEFTPRDKLECVKRELIMRKKVYPRWVEQGKMTLTKADHEIAVMASIVEDYLADVEG
jgi:hypothetical protein